MYKGATYWALKGTGKWPSAFYGLLTTLPTKFRRFEFENGMVSAIRAPDEAHPSFAEYERLHLFQKASVTESTDFLHYPGWLIDAAREKAPSPTNLALMLYAGNPMTRGPMMEKGFAA